MKKNEKELQYGVDYVELWGHKITPRMVDAMHELHQNVGDTENLRRWIVEVQAGTLYLISKGADFKDYAGLDHFVGSLQMLYELTQNTDIFAREKFEVETLTDLQK